jgi:integrase
LTLRNATFLRSRSRLSHVELSTAEWGYTAGQNPCQGVKGFRETGRDRYVTDAEFAQVKALAHPTVADAMDLALLTGQRPADVLKLKRTDVRDGAVWVVQNKTGARIGIEVTGGRAATLERINLRPRRAISAFLIQDEDGQPLTQGALRSPFDKARRAAGSVFNSVICEPKPPLILATWRTPKSYSLTRIGT